MDEKQIYSELTLVFRNVLDEDSLVLRPDLTAHDVEAWDSLAHVSLVVAAEKQFGIKFKTAELESLQNVGQFVSLIGHKLSLK